MTDKLTWHYFELPKLSNEINIDNELDLWLKLFGAETEEDLSKLECLEVPVVQQIINAYRDITATDEFLRLARAREDALHDEASALAHAEKKGERKGEQRGIQIGEQRGERNQLKRTVQKSLSSSMFKTIGLPVLYETIDAPQNEIDAIVSELKAEYPGRYV